MTSPLRVIGWFAAVVVATLLVVLLVQVFTPPPTMPPVTSIRYLQSKASPQFTASAHTVDSPGRISQFTALLKKYAIDPANFDRTLNDVCTGGLATDITLRFEDAASDRLRIYDCGRTVAGGTFVTDATALVTAWNASDSGN